MEIRDCMSRNITAWFFYKNLTKKNEFIKKVIAIIIVAVLFVSLCSCGKPNSTSDSMYQIGLNALSAADDYIAGKISGEEANNKLKEYNRQATAQYEISKAEEFDKDFNISFAISMLSYAVFDSTRIITTGPMSEVKEKRDDLAKALGK